MVPVGGFCCRHHWALIPVAIRTDLQTCLDHGTAWTDNPLWISAVAAAFDAVALTVIHSAANGNTARTYSRPLQASRR